MPPSGWLPGKVIFQHALVAQLDRATGYEPVGQEFESLRAHHHKNKRSAFGLAAFCIFGRSLPADIPGPGRHRVLAMSLPPVWQVRLICGICATKRAALPLCQEARPILAVVWGTKARQHLLVVTYTGSQGRKAQSAMPFVFCREASGAFRQQRHGQEDTWARPVMLISLPWHRRDGAGRLRLGERHLSCLPFRLPPALPAGGESLILEEK